MRRLHLIQRNLRLLFLVLTTAAISLLAHSPGLSEQALTITSGMQFDYAENLLAKGDYPRAIDEYKRFIHYFPEDDRVDLAQYQIGMAYFQSHRFGPATEAFGILIDRIAARQPTNERLFVKAHWRVSECHVNLRQYGEAILALENLIAVVNDAKIKDEAYYRIGWIHVESVSFEKARETFGMISDENNQRFQVERISEGLRKPLNIPRKSPAFAGVLSVIPGAGYVYTQRYRDALIAFLVNGALILATYESFDNELYALGAIVGVVGAGFYAANIYGATTAAHKYNQRQTRNFIESLKQNTKVQLSADYKNKGISVALQFKF